MTQTSVRVRVRWRAQHVGLVVARQGLRLIHPMTLLRAAYAVVRGLARAAGLLFGFLRGHDIADVRARSPLHWQDAVRTRVRAARVAAVIAIGLAVWLWARYPVAAYLLLGALLVGMFLLGRGDRVLVDAPELASILPQELVVRQSVVDAGLARDIEQVALKAPIQRAGDAWTTRVELPSGQTYRKAVARRAEWASALGVSVIQLDLLPVQSSERLVDVWCADRDPYGRKPVVSPLVRHPRPVDLWQPVRVGLDARGLEVKVLLPFGGVLVGGLPRYGKTVSANNLLAAVTLDVHAQLWLADGKGLDSRPLLPLAHRTATRDPHTLLQLLVELDQEKNRRYDRLAELGLDQLSREVCHAEMPLIVLWIDELRHYTDCPDKTLAREICSYLIELASVGPAAGITPVLATQRPSSEVVPTDLRDLIPMRWALRCGTAASSDMVLGQGAASKGANAAELPPEHKGVSILIGAISRSVTLRSDLLNLDGLTAVCQYATELRRAAGVLVGQAGRAGTPPILGAMLAAMLAGEGIDRMPTAALLAVLQDANPGQWTGWDGTALAREVRRYGLKPRQLGGDGNPRGYRLDDVQEAIRRAA